MPSCNARKIEKAADNRKVFKAFLTDLSKVFDCLPHELTTVKINADGLSFHSSKLINNYLWHRKQKVKKKYSYSSWDAILFGVCQDFGYF